MLALVLVIGHFILSRLGIAYRAVTAFYSTGGKNPCDEEVVVNEPCPESIYKSRVKPVYRTLSPVEVSLPTYQTVQSIEPSKKSKTTSFIPLTESCGPEISPSRNIMSPIQCTETLAWRTNRCRPMAAGYTADALEMPSYISQTQSRSGYVSPAGGSYSQPPGSGYYGGPSQSQGYCCGAGPPLPAMPSAGYYGGPSQPQSGYYGAPSQPAYDPRQSRQSAAMMTPRASGMSQGMSCPPLSCGPPMVGGDLERKMRFQFRPSKIPSAYRFPCPDDIPCTNEDFPQQSIPNMRMPSQPAHFSNVPISGYASSPTPRSSPPRSLSSQRSPSRGASPPPTIPPSGYVGYQGDEIDEIISMNTGYAGQLSGAPPSGMYPVPDDRGIGSVPQTPSSLAYSQARTSRQSGCGSPYQESSHGSGCPTAYPTAYSSGHSTDYGGPSRLTTARSAIAKSSKPISAFCCGKSSGFDDGPLPRPPKRKTMSTADDFCQSRATTKRSQMGTDSPISTLSHPSMEYAASSFGSMQPGSRIAPTQHSRPITIGTALTSTKPQMVAAGSPHQVARPVAVKGNVSGAAQKNKARQASGLYSVNASGIRSVSEQDVQHPTAMSRAGADAPTMGNSAGMTCSKNTGLDLDCISFDQNNF